MNTSLSQNMSAATCNSVCKQLHFSPVLQLLTVSHQTDTSSGLGFTLLRLMNTLSRVMPLVSHFHAPQLAVLRTLF